MYYDAMRKLRALSTEAYAKLWVNRYKRTPGKWAEHCYDDEGKRTWHNAPISFLIDKLQEEVDELKQEVTSREVTFTSVRKEAGDVVACVMALVDRVGGWNGSAMRPKVVCLCGSTKFKEEFLRQSGLETLKGNIVLSVGFFMHADHVVYRESEKELLDDLHKRKIDLADEIFVLNVDGYIGDSTRGEILHAIQTGKDVRYLEDPNLTTGPHPVTPQDDDTRWPFPTGHNPNPLI